MPTPHLLLGLAIAGLTLTSLTPVVNAQEQRWRGSVAGQTLFARPGRRRLGDRVVRRVSPSRQRARSAYHRDHERTPGHYVYRGLYPYWAARAFQPAQSR